MSIPSILLGLALAALVLPFVAGPFLKDARRRRQAQTDGRQQAQEAKQNALFALRDLDFDFHTGKIADEDYAPLRQRLLAEAAAAQPGSESESDLDDEIEAAVSGSRQTARAARVAPAVPICPNCHASIRGDERFCPHCGATLGLACPQCRARITTADQFCSHCGAPLKLEALPA